jgi:hypothetical protein
LFARVCIPIAILLAGCTSNSTPPGPYKLYPGPARPTAELARLKLGDAFAVRLDGLMVAASDWDQVVLLPGPHQVDTIVEYGASVMVEPSGFGHASTHLEADLAAGHTYVIHYARTHGEGYQVWLWMEDAANESVVAVKKKP